MKGQRTLSSIEELNAILAEKVRGMEKDEALRFLNGFRESVLALSDANHQRTALLDLHLRNFASHLPGTGEIALKGEAPIVRLSDQAVYGFRYPEEATRGEVDALQHASRERAAAILDNFSVFIPQRISKEEIGDALEDINRRIAAGQTWQVRWRIVTTVAYTAVSTFGFFMSNLFGRKKAG